MAKGIVLCQGDKTSCGGKITAGSAIGSAFKQPIAREGDPVTCGKDGNIYRIIGGISFMTSGTDKKRVAGSLDSYSSCPCKAKIFPLNPYPAYFKEEQASNTSSSLQPLFASPLSYSPEAEPVQRAQSTKNRKSLESEGVDAGFCVLPNGGNASSLERRIFTPQASNETLELFRSLNSNSNDYKSGSIVLVVDPYKQEREQIAHMQVAKARIDAALEPLTREEADFLHKHYATIANFTSYADSGIGLASEPVSIYYERIEKILKEIQITYQNTYTTRGSLIGEQFYVRRAQLFRDLDNLLKLGFLNKRIHLNQHTKLKNALGLSSSSIAHKWNQTGVGEIEGYAVHIEKAAKYVIMMRYAGYASIGFSALHSLNEIQEACTIGREDECRKTKFTEVGSFTGSTALGIFAGSAGASTAGALCIGLGIATGGTGSLLCAAVVVGSAGYLGAEAGGFLGEKAGTLLYEVMENN